MRKKEVLTILAFLLFITGFVSLTLSLVGIKLSILAWIDQISPLLGLIIKVGMILGSLIILALLNSNEGQKNTSDLD